MNDENKSFSYSYSGKTNDELEQIKEKYTQTRTNQKLNEIRRLDRRVEFLSTMLSIGLGIVGTFLLVCGIISIVASRDNLIIGSICTLLGLIIDSTVPLVHFKIATRIKSYVAPQILALIKEIEQNQI